jgi:hypothetical protein
MAFELNREYLYKPISHFQYLCEYLFGKLESWVVVKKETTVTSFNGLLS